MPYSALPQVAATAVQELAGPQCTDIIICPQVRLSILYACIGLQCTAPTDPRPPPPIIQAREEEEDGDAEAALGTLTIECSLLALEAIEEAGTWLAGGGLMRVASTLLLIEEAGK